MRRVILDRFISVDVEASGPVPGEFSMLSLGACVVGQIEEQFYVELKPITDRQEPGAMRVNGLDHDALQQRGTDPIQAMLAFESWIHRVTPDGYRPIFVAYPATFDWMFVAYYFHRFLARNPFGVTGLDLTSMHAGTAGAAASPPWTVDELEHRLSAGLPRTHNALEDAIAQSRLFERQLLRRREADDFDNVVGAAARAGVELDPGEARTWIVAASAAERDAFAQDAATGVFGHGVSLIDFDPADLEYFRYLARHVRAAARPGVESAIAIAGSAAQGKAQVFPGDYDFYERVNVKADTLDAARATLRDVVRETARRAEREPDIVLVEVNFGVYPRAVVERGTPRSAGDPITWLPADVVRGSIAVSGADGQPLVVEWDDVAGGPGWTYIGWIVVEPDGGRIALASNMMEVTWESPSGDLIALDGSIDPCLQEVYLEPDAIPLFQKLVARVDRAATHAYADAMRTQAHHYLHAQPNFCKASKRLYNLFRLTGELAAAAYLRELFDEPAARMYQVPGLLDAADHALRSTTKIRRDVIVRQLDLVIWTVVKAGGAAAADLVMELIRLRDGLVGSATSEAAWADGLRASRARCSEMVSEYFRSRLFGLPRIAQLAAELNRS